MNCQYLFCPEKPGHSPQCGIFDGQGQSSSALPEESPQEFEVN